MGTRAAAFTAKIKNLQDYYLRLLHGIPLPSELDIACTLKYFSLTLMGVLKDVPEAPLVMLRRPDQDATRLALYPSLDYTGLHRALVQLFDIVPLLQYGVHGFGQSLLHTMSCLVPFLEHSLIDTLPYLVASSLATFPVSLHRDIVNTLCHYLLPFTLSPDVENYTSSSITAIVMVVFQYTDVTALHCQLLETVMSRRRMVIRDLFCIIAHGTVSARLPAAHLLFHYWPALNPSSADRRGHLLKFTGLDIEDIGWEPHQCERDNCPSNENNEAIQLCLDHNVAVLQGSEYPPPLYLCQHCSQDIRAANSQISMFEILLPMQHVSTTCENKNCRSNEKLAICTCFSIECASYNGNRPIRYCAQCDSIRHNNRRGGDHLVQYRIGSPWKMAPDVSRYMVEAVVSLLKEAQPLADSRRSREQDRHTRAGLLDDANQPEGPSLEERRSLSRYGVWLLVNLCTPDRTTPDATLARLLAALFNWFEATAYLGDDQTGGALELLKSEYIHSWLQNILAGHFKTFASCLLPRPPEYARVGGHWDGLVSKTQHIQEGFHRLFCLVPYDIISADLWNHIMPNWLEAILQDVPEDELPELKIILSKLLDPDMSPLGFDADQMYQFVSVRFHSSAPRVQEQALAWLQILSMVNIAIPLPILHKMLRSGVRCLHVSRDGPSCRKVSSIRSQVNTDLGPVVQSESRAASPLSGEDGMPEEEAPLDTVDTADLVVPCFVLMLDVLLKQMEIQDIQRSQGVQNSLSQQAVVLLKAMLSSPTEGRHTCDPDDMPVFETYRENGKDEPVRVDQCDACEALLELYQLAGELLSYICPQEMVKPVELVEEAEPGMESPPPAQQEEPPPHVQEKPATAPEEHVVPVEAPQMGQQSQVMMATETVTEMDVAASMPAEKVMRAVAKAVTISEDDIAVAKVKVVAARLVGENDQPVLVPTIEEGDNFWTTSHGRFRFTVDELPPDLQLLYGLLNRVKECDDQDVTSHLLSCLRLLVLHADCLQRAARDHRGFHIWCQENLVIKQLWDLLQAEYSQVPEIAVPVLLHAITLPCGADVFWQIVGNEFHSDDWKVRFTAVERATVLARFLEPPMVRQCGASIQAPLAHVFSYLIHAVDDLSAAVAQKVQLYMETIPDGGIRTICMCLETQFDTVIVDRPLVLKTVLQLFHLLPARGILSWEFFNSRLDSLVMETQIRLERRGDIPLMKDLKSDGGASEAYLRRLTRAHEALTSAAAGSGHRRTLNSSIGTKWPYKRTMSAPAVVPRPDKNDMQKHSYPRQASAPILKRKASRFGISQVNHVPENSKTSAAAAPGSDACLSLVYRSLDSDEGDRETTHLLVDLLMKFMARPDQAPPGDDKQQCRSQQLVLRHLSMMLGFNQTDKTFFMSPARLRSKAAFNAFLSHLNLVLDHNFPLGSALLPLCLPVLLYSAAPSRQSAETSGRPAYSLWHLEERQRHDWLSALLTVLYKNVSCAPLQYQYGDPTLSGPLLALCQVVLNTLHLCRPLGSLVDLEEVSPMQSVQPVRVGSFSGLGVVELATVVPELVTMVDPAQVVCQLVEQVPAADCKYGTAAAPAEESVALARCQPAVAAVGPTVHEQPIVSALSHVTSIGSVPFLPGASPFEHSLSLEAQPSPAESWQQPRAQSLAIARSEPAPANGAANGTERSLLERLSLVFSKQDSHGPGAAGRLVSSLQLQLGAGQAAPDGKSREPDTLANQSSASTEDDAGTPGDEPAVHRAYIKQPKSKKLGLSPVEQAAAESRTASRWSRRDKPAEEKPAPNVKQCSLRVGNDCVQERCPQCGQVREDYTEEELGLCVVVLATFVHREPSLAACMLPDMLRAVSTLAGRQRYPWQSESSYSLPGSVNSVCRQFLRCVLHRLAAHNMFFKLFQVDMDVETTHAFYRTLAQALADFAELNTAAPLHHLLEYLNRQRTAPCLDEMPTILYNMSVYLESVPLETAGQLYGPLVPQLDVLFRRLLPCLAALPELDSLLAIMCSLLKIPTVNMYKTVLEPFSKVVSLLVQSRPIDYRRLVELCHLCNRVFSREREKQQLSRVVVFELVQALKFKSNPPDTNLLLLVHFVVQDAGGAMAPSTVLDQVPDLGTDTAGSTAASECMRQHLNDTLDFLADVHTLTKIKSNCGGPLRGLNEDTMGGVLKAGIAQFVALEISRGNSRESRAIGRYLPWLYNPPSPVQQGPKEFIDCVSHIRLLSWLLLGAMTHAAVMGPHATVTCQPVPLEASCHIADHIQVILAGFAEQSKASVLHMSSLFHAFILCQLWTMYLEVVSAGQAPPGHEQHQAALAILADFWAKVTPGILQLVSHSRVLGEMVNLHFLSLMEALAECNASTLARLLPVWTQVFYAYNQQLPGHLSVRLQNCQSQPPAGHSCQQLLLSWIQRLQFKMGQIELQSSAAAQFYTV
ncbi:protein unc-79 homolog [Pollicipes pollicipes]|uniref:protein unc-79 homolog n=1 Tax=Pollicipes pollicipes TaxID=41117 RepID=UPI001884CAC7|nr:protein unc-79 homolog [Pollicipes pollicipes]